MHSKYFIPFFPPSISKAFRSGFPMTEIHHIEHADYFVWFMFKYESLMKHFIIIYYRYNHRLDMPSEQFMICSLVYAARHALLCGTLYCIQHKINDVSHKILLYASCNPTKKSCTPNPQPRTSAYNKWIKMNTHSNELNSASFIIFCAKPTNCATQKWSTSPKSKSDQ